MNVGSFDWSPDGAKIVYDHTEIPTANSSSTSNISIVGQQMDLQVIVDWGGFDASQSFPMTEKG